MNATAETIEPSANCRIYVACLASYNNGRLYGRWIDCDDKDPDELRDEVNEMLRGSPYPNVEVDCPTCEDVDSEGCETCNGRGKVPSAEEWAIHDHEGFAGLLEESTSLETVAELAAVLAEGDASIFGLVYLARYCGYSLSDAADRAGDVTIFQDANALGEDGLLASYAQDLAEDCYGDALEGLPSFIRYNIDWAGVGHELQIGGDVATGEYGGERFLVANASEF